MAVWVGAMNSPPRSATVPSGMACDQVRPPTRSRASSTTTSWPASSRRRAAVSPDSPAPTTTTSMSGSAALVAAAPREAREGGQRRLGLHGAVRQQAVQAREVERVPAVLVLGQPGLPVDALEVQLLATGGQE